MHASRSEWLKDSGAYLQTLIHASAVSDAILLILLVTMDHPHGTPGHAQDNDAPF